MSVALTGKDTIILDTRILSDLATGDVANLEFPNDLVDAKTGKNGNTIFAFNATGKVVNATIRVIRASADDQYLNSRLYQYLNDPPSFVAIEAEMVKRVGDAAGNIKNDTYQISGGLISKIPSVKENVEGDIEQAVSIWAIKFANSDRRIG
jgi:hypothetical protein